MKNRVLGLTEIAELLDFTVGTVHVMSSRGQLPEPDLRLAMGPLWRKETIVKWAAEKGREIHEDST